MRRKMMSDSTKCVSITYSGQVSRWPSASGSRYSAPSAVITSRRMPCSCSVSGRAARRARSRAKKPVGAAAAASVDSAIRRGPRAVAPLILGLQYFLAHAQEGFDHARVEVPAALRAQVVERLLARQGRLVRPHRGQRVIHVGHCDDARAQRDVVADQPVGVARSVVLLVVAERDQRAHAHVLGGAALQDLVGRSPGAAHHLPLALLERLRLEQDLVGDADLADVVQRRGELDGLASSRSSRARWR
jgi:hypothetical protein